MKRKIIKVGFCVAYDWQFLKTSIPIVYKEADSICLSIDKDRKSWAGNPYTFDENAFRSFISTIDVDKKILIYEDDFHLPELTAWENDTRQRKMMAVAMGKADWYVQLDSDEYFLGFKGFVDFLRNLEVSKPANVICPSVILWKKTESGFLYIRYNKFTDYETHPIATNKPEYVASRATGFIDLRAPYYVLHQSWARDDQEMKFKLTNWGHNDQIDADKYFNFWLSINENNYQTVKDFHPIVPETWPALGLINFNTPAELIAKIDTLKLPSISNYELWRANSIWIKRFNALKHRLFN